MDIELSVKIFKETENATIAVKGSRLDLMNALANLTYHLKDEEVLDEDEIMASVAVGLGKSNKDETDVLKEAKDFLKKILK